MRPPIPPLPAALLALAGLIAPAAFAADLSEQDLARITPCLVLSTLQQNLAKLRAAGRTA